MIIINLVYNFEFKESNYKVFVYIKWYAKNSRLFSIYFYLIFAILEPIFLKVRYVRRTKSQTSIYPLTFTY